MLRSVKACFVYVFASTSAGTHAPKRALPCSVTSAAFFGNSDILFWKRGFHLYGTENDLEEVRERGQQKN